MIRIYVLLALTVLAIVQNYWYWMLLPESVAIHFGLHGAPNQWMNKNGAVVLMLSIQVLLPWMLIGIGKSLKRLPTSMINIPNREYWLHPDRRDSTLNHVQGMLGSIAIAESILIAVANHLSFNANRTGMPLDTRTFLLVLATFVIGILALVFSSFARLGTGALR